MSPKIDYEKAHREIERRLAAANAARTDSARSKEFDEKYEITQANMNFSEATAAQIGEFCMHLEKVMGAEDLSQGHTVGQMGALLKGEPITELQNRRIALNQLLVALEGMSDYYLPGPRFERRSTCPWILHLVRRKEDGRMVMAVVSNPYSQGRSMVDIHVLARPEVQKDGLAQQLFRKSSNPPADMEEHLEIPPQELGLVLENALRAHIEALNPDFVSTLCIPRNAATRTLPQTEKIGLHGWKAEVEAGMNMHMLHRPKP